MDSILSAMGRPQPRPIRVLQFGEGNFLRAFVDYMLDILNEKDLLNGGIVLVKPIPHGDLAAFHAQQCLYTVVLRGLVDGQPATLTRPVTSVMDAVDSYAEYEKYAAYARCETLRFIVSNTTEAGIVLDETDELSFCPPKSYPGKLTKLLFERAQAFDYAPDKGLVILPVELIDDNGGELKRCVTTLARKWALGERFLRWLDEACVFTSTLVDRIVTGYPKDEAEALWRQLGYEDRLLVTGEPFALWVIQSPKDLSAELPFAKAGLPVVFTDDQRPYKQRKVRILNGAHTSFVLASFLMGHDTVFESMRDPLVKRYMQDTLMSEVIPTLSLPRDDLLSFAQAVTGRFENPYIKHALLSISLNSVSKWRARCLPSLLGYVERKQALPPHLVFSLAALLAFYQGDHIENGALVGSRNGQPYRIMDDEQVLRFFLDHQNTDVAGLVHDYLGQTGFHGQDLRLIPGLEQAVAGYLADIRTLGMQQAMERHCGD